MSAATAGPYVVLVLLGCGALELLARRTGEARRGAARCRPSAPVALGSLAWVAFKVGALSYGGGFVIIPLMQGDAVDTSTTG